MRKTTKNPRAKIVKDIKRATRKQYSSEAKIRIVLDGLRGEDSMPGNTSTGARLLRKSLRHPQRHFSGV